MTTYLATYGTLAPSRANHQQSAGLEGQWFKGIVRGRLMQAGWASKFGFPDLVLEPAGEAVDVEVCASSDLPRHWTSLSAFEGNEYRRALAAVETSGEIVEAWICVLNSSRDLARTTYSIKQKILIFCAALTQLQQLIWPNKLSACFVVLNRVAKIYSAHEIIAGMHPQ